MSECELVEDLLPLYLEKLLGETTMEFVKAHLAHCGNCKRLYDRLSVQEKGFSEENLALSEKEKSVGKIMKGYKKWLYSIITIAVIFSLMGGIGGTYFMMKYEELIPNHIAQDFVKYGLKGDRWVYQERVSQALKKKLSLDKYTELKTWEEFEKNSRQVKPSGIKVYKKITAQEYGPIDVTLQVGLVLEKGGFRVFQVSIHDKAEYTRKKTMLEQALIDKNNNSKHTAINDLDKQYVSVPPADPTQGEYFVEGRILEITGNNIIIEQHMDTHSVPKESFLVTKDTVIVRHHIIKDSDYYRKIETKELKVGNVIFIIFTKENVPRIVAVTQ